MSLSEDSVSCPTENSVTVHLDSASVSDAETVLKNTNVHSCLFEEETQNDSELLKGLLTDTFCQVCEAVLMFESQRVSHYEGKKHAQRVRIYLQTKKAERNKQSCESSSFQSVSADPEKFCELCNMVFSSSVVAKSHYEGKVHAKNVRKSSNTASVDARTTVSPAAPPVNADTVEASAQGEEVQEQKESTASAAQGIDLSDPDKHCKLCAASFNNPTMAAEHYNGRKHQRNLARQEVQSTLGEQSEPANSLTCPLCHVTLISIETYQAHMKGNKHHIKEQKIQEDVCKKKVYNSFQDELADYIQVQRSRGLEPKTGQGSEPQGLRKAERDVDESGECCDQPQALSFQPRLPAPAFRGQPWRAPFHPPPNRTAFRGRFPVPNQWDQGYSSYPPPLIPGLTGRALRRGRSPESGSSSSSFSDSSSSYSSTSSSSEDRRRQRKKRREGMKKRREEEEDSDEEANRRRQERRRKEHGGVKKEKRHRGNSDDDHGKRWKEKKHKERVAKKRRREVEEGEWNRVVMAKGDGEGEVQHEGLKEEKGKHKKEKKKAKDSEDKRTEEEKLWDETILGMF